MKNQFKLFSLFLGLLVITSCSDDDGPKNANPVAAFQRSTAIAVLGAPISFTDASTDEDGEIVQWFWDFGDGTGTSSDQNPTYSYSTEGTFTVTLTVTDDKGGTGEAEEIVRIEGNFVSNWEFSATDVFGTSGPVIGVDGKIFIGSQDFNIYGINADGSEAWRFTTENKVRSTGAFSNGIVYFGGIDGKLYALNGSDGSLQWSYDLGDEVFIGGPSINDDGTIFIGTRDQNVPENVYAVNSDGTLKWSVAVGEGGAKVRTAGTISDDGSTVYFGSSEGVLYAFSTSDGSVLWTFATGGNIESTPALDSDGVLYILDLMTVTYTL